MLDSPLSVAVAFVLKVFSSFYVSFCLVVSSMRDVSPIWLMYSWLRCFWSKHNGVRDTSGLFDAGVVDSDYINFYKKLHSKVNLS